MVYQNFFVFGVLEALKQEREEMGKTAQILRVPVWTNIVIFMLGIMLVVVATIFVPSAVVSNGAMDYQLLEVDYIITFFCYVIGGIAMFISWGNLWRNNLKQVVLPKLKKCFKNEN